MMSYAPGQEIVGRDAPSDGRIPPHGTPHGAKKQRDTYTTGIPPYNCTSTGKKLARGFPVPMFAVFFTANFLL